MTAAIAKFREDKSKDGGGWALRHNTLGLKRPMKGILIAAGGTTQFVNALATMKARIHSPAIAVAS